MLNCGFFLTVCAEYYYFIQLLNFAFISDLPTSCPRVYLPPKIPRKKKQHEVMPVHVGADNVVVQQITEYSHYFNAMMEDMQMVYNSDTHSLLSICCPQIGQFSHK